jgi:hypothetical protein
VFGIALGVTAAIGVAPGWTEPYWVPEPVLLLTLAIVRALGDCETERHPDPELA